MQETDKTGNRKHGSIEEFKKCQDFVDFIILRDIPDIGKKCGDSLYYLTEKRVRKFYDDFMNANLYKTVSLDEFYNNIDQYAQLPHDHNHSDKNMKV